MIPGGIWTLTRISGSISKEGVFRRLTRRAAREDGEKVSEKNRGCPVMRPRSRVRRVRGGEAADRGDSGGAVGGLLGGECGLRPPGASGKQRADGHFGLGSGEQALPMADRRAADPL